MKKEFTVGEKVRLVILPPYVKTAETKPMLRPPNVVSLGEEGVVVDRRPGGYWGVRFAGGTFLIDSQYIEAIAIPPETAHTSAPLSEDTSASEDRS